MLDAYNHAKESVVQACAIEIPTVVSGEDLRNWLMSGQETDFRKAAFVLADVLFSYLWGKLVDKEDDEGVFMACMVSQAMDGTPSRLVEMMEQTLKNAMQRFRSYRNFVDFVMTLFAKWVCISKREFLLAA